MARSLINTRPRKQGPSKDNKTDGKKTLHHQDDGRRGVMRSPVD